MPHDKKDRSVGFRAPADLIDEAKERAKADRRSLSNYILKLIEDDIERNKEKAKNDE